MSSLHPSPPVAALLALTLSIGLPSQSRPLAIEDYYYVHSVGSPQLSPDGAWVAYTVSTRREATNDDGRTAWLVPTDGSAQPRRIQHRGKDVGNPRWTDAGLLRYRADGDWVVDVRSAEAEPRPAPESPRGLPSPDGRWRARLVEVPVAPEPKPKLTDFERRHLERFEGEQFDWMYFQRDGRPIPVPDPRRRSAQEIEIVPANGGEGVRLTELGLRPSGLAWRADGSMLVFTADAHFRDEMTYGRSDLWTVTTSGEVNRLTDDGYTYSSTAFSPDGKYLSYTRGFGTDLVIAKRLDHGGPRDLFVWPVGADEPINLTASWDLTPGRPQWSPDSRYLYFTTGIGGETQLFRVAASGGEVEQVTRGPRRIGGLAFDAKFERIAYTVSRFEAPSDIYTAKIDGSGERRLTDVNRDSLRDVALSRAERLSFRSADGTAIEGWLLLPYGYREDGGPYPIIVNSHGGPHSASGYRFNFKHQLFAAHGYFVLQVNFRSSTGYGEEFKWATWGAWGDKDGQDVMAGIDHAIASYPIDPQRVGHTGHSYGGFMTNWLITQYPDRFAAAIAGAGISNWVSDYGTADIARTKETEFYGTPWQEEARNRMIRQSPLTYADRATAPTLFVHGAEDQRVPYEEAEQMYFALKKNGVPAKMIRYAGQAHGIRGHWNGVHRMLNELWWWERYLGPSRGQR